MYTVFLISVYILACLLGCLAGVIVKYLLVPSPANDHITRVENIVAYALLAVCTILFAYSFVTQSPLPYPVLFNAMMIFIISATGVMIAVPFLPDAKTREIERLAMYALGGLIVLNLSVVLYTHYQVGLQFEDFLERHFDALPQTPGMSTPRFRREYLSENRQSLWSQFEKKLSTPNTNHERVSQICDKTPEELEIISKDANTFSNYISQEHRPEIVDCLSEEFRIRNPREHLRFRKSLIHPRTSSLTEEEDTIPLFQISDV